MYAMKRLYSAGTALEAHDLRFYLAAHGIEAKVFGDNNAWEGPFAFTPDSAPGVFVDDPDFDAASKVLDEFLDHPRTAAAEGRWRCPSCKELVEAQFDQCWNCQSVRGDAPIETSTLPPSDEVNEDEVAPTTSARVNKLDVQASRCSPLRSRYSLLAEVLAVLALAAPVFDGQSVASAVLHAMGFRNTVSNFLLPSLLANAFVIAVTLFAIRNSREPCSNFGITRPDWLDVIGAAIVYLAHRLVTSIGIQMLYDLLEWLYGAQSVERLMEARHGVIHATGLLGLVALLLHSAFVGFAEELVTRGYLIPRLERILRSTWAAVLVSAVVFGLLHLHLDVFSAWGAFLAGLVYGVAFAWSRRLWPVVIAHTAWDFSVLLHRAVG